jgi:hypothetical protein
MPGHELVLEKWRVGGGSPHTFGIRRDTRKIDTTEVSVYTE